LADVNQVRVSLGQQAQSEDSADLDTVPPDLDQTFSSVLQAQAELIQTAAELGVLHSYNQTPKQMLEEFYKLDPEGDVNRTFDRLAAEAPPVKQAEAKLVAAKRDLALAELDLRYCDVVAEIDGVVTRRNVNPGNDVQVGQNLMAIRSLSEIWVDANFGLLSLLRNEGGSVGTSLAQTIQERRDQFHILRLGESLDSFNAAVISFFDQARALFLQQTGDPSAAQQLALQALENLRQQQASSLAYFDVFLLLAVVTLALIPVVLLMKRSVAEKGAHIGQE